MMPAYATGGEGGGRGVGSRGEGLAKGEGEASYNSRILSASPAVPLTLCMVPLYRLAGLCIYAPSTSLRLSFWLEFVFSLLWKRSCLASCFGSYLSCRYFFLFFFFRASMRYSNVFQISSCILPHPELPLHYPDVTLSQKLPS